VAIDFGTRETETAKSGFGGFALQATIVESMRAIAMGLAIIVALGILFFVIRSISNTLDLARVQIPPDIEFEKKRAKITEEDEEKETEKSVLVRKIVAKAIKDPESIARSLKTFYPED